MKKTTEGIHFNNAADESRARSKKTPLRIPMHQIELASVKNGQPKEPVQITKSNQTMPN